MAIAELAGLEGRRALVTGAGGFIGSHLAERLVEAGARVRALCHYGSAGSHGWLEASPLAREMDMRLGEVRDVRFVEELCSGIEVVFHLAALVAIPYSYQAPESFIDTNVRGTLNVLEAVRRNGCARLVHTSTSEVYGQAEQLPIRESNALRGQSPYSASKIAADKLCEAYACSYAVPVVVLRPFNTYGPRQSARAVLPTILAQLLSGAAEVRLGRLEPRRDLTFVTDTVAAFLKAATASGLEPGETIHLGTGQAVSIKELFEAACDATGRHARVVCEAARIRPEKSEIQTLLSDPSRAAERLAWRPTVTLQHGLRATADWIAQNLGRYRTGVYQV